MKTQGAKRTVYEMIVRVEAHEWPFLTMRAALEKRIVPAFPEYDIRPVVANRNSPSSVGHPDFVLGKTIWMSFIASYRREGIAQFSTILERSINNYNRSCSRRGLCWWTTCFDERKPPRQERIITSIDSRFCCGGRGRPIEYLRMSIQRKTIKLYTIWTDCWLFVYRLNDRHGLQRLRAREWEWWRVCWSWGSVRYSVRDSITQSLVPLLVVPSDQSNLSNELEWGAAQS